MGVVTTKKIESGLDVQDWMFRKIWKLCEGVVGTMQFAVTLIPSWLSAINLIISIMVILQFEELKVLQYFQDNRRYYYVSKLAFEINEIYSNRFSFSRNHIIASL